MIAEPDDSSSRNRSKLGEIEAIAGLAFAWLISALFAAALSMALSLLLPTSIQHNYALWPGILILLVFIGAILLDVGLLRPLWNDRHVLDIASTSLVTFDRDLPSPIRIALAVWWVGHFSVGLFLAGFVEYVSTSLPAMPHERTYGLDIILSMIVAFGFSFAGNLFLILAAGQLSDRATVLKSIWRLRLLWDSLIAITVGLTILLRK